MIPDFPREMRIRKTTANSTRPNAPRPRATSTRRKITPMTASRWARAALRFNRDPPEGRAPRVRNQAADEVNETHSDPAWTTPGKGSSTNHTNHTNSSCRIGVSGVIRGHLRFGRGVTDSQSSSLRGVRPPTPVHPASGASANGARRDDRAPGQRRYRPPLPPWSAACRTTGWPGAGGLPPARGVRSSARG